MNSFEQVWRLLGSASAPALLLALCIGFGASAASGCLSNPTPHPGLDDREPGFGQDLDGEVRVDDGDALPAEGHDGVLPPCAPDGGSVDADGAEDGGETPGAGPDGWADPCEDASGEEVPGDVGPDPGEGDG